MAEDTRISTKPKRRFPYWARGLVGLVILIMVILFAGRWYIGGQGGRNLLENQLETRVFSGQKVELSGLKGDILGEFEFDRLVLSDDEGEWAELTDVRIGWKPFSLIGRSLIIDELALGELHVMRRPNLPVTPPEDKQSGGDFPLNSVQLSDLDITRFALDEGVTPSEVTGSALGQLVWTKQRARIDMSVSPGQTGGDLLKASLGWDERSPINGQLTLDGPAGGLFASLLQLDADQSVSADFQAEGDAQTITGNGSAKIDDQDWLSLSIEPRDGTYKVSLLAQTTVHPLTRDQVDRIGDQIAVTTVLDTRMKDKILHVQVDTPVMLLDAYRISIDAPEKSAQIEFTLKDPSAILPEDQARLSELRLLGDVAMRDGRYTFGGRIQGKTLTTEQFSATDISGPLSLTFADQTLEGQTSLRAETVSLKLRDDRKSIRTANLDAGFRYGLEGGDLELKSVAISTPRSTLKLNGNGAFSETIILKVTGNADADLAELGLYEAGRVSGAFELEQGRDEAQNFSLDLTGTDLEGAVEGLSPWIGSAVLLDAKGVRSKSGLIAISDLNLKTDAIQIAADGNLTETSEIRLNGRFETSETYPLAETLPGLVGDFTLTGPMDALNINADIRADRLLEGENSLNIIALNFDGSYRDEALAGQVGLTGDFRAAPLTLNSGVSYSGGGWMLDGIGGNWQDIELTGALSGEGGDLSTIDANLKLAGELPEDFPGQTVEMSIVAKGESLDIEGGLTDIQTAAFSKGALTFSVEGVRDDLGFDLSLDGISQIGGLPQPANLILRGNVKGLTTDTIIISGTSTSEIGGQILETPEPFSIVQGQDGLTGELLIAGIDGRMRVEATANTARPLVVTIEDIGVAPVLRLLGRAPMEGKADMILTVFSENGSPRAELTGQLKSLIAPGRDADPVSFNLRGLFDDQKGTLELATPDSQLLSGFLELDLPVAAQLSAPYFKWQEDGKGGFNARFDGQVDNMSSIFLPADLTLKGQLNANIKGSIPFLPESLEGQMTYRNGAFAQEKLGTELEAISFDLDIAQQTLRLTSFSARGRKGGTLDGSGVLDLTDGLQSDLNLTARNLVVISRREARAVASGTLGLAVNDDVFEIIGDLRVNEGFFRLDSLPTSSAPTLDVSFDTDEAQKPAPRRVTLNLRVHAPHSVQLVGQGMDAEVGLDTRITGTTNDPQINGTARIVRGRFELLGKRFIFQESNIEFNGDPMKARLGIVATRETDDFTAKVTISGTPTKPEVTLGAEPDLPEDEVLSRVLFGRSPSQLSGLEAARLAAALASLSGGGGFDLMGGLENLTGLDNLDVSQNASGEFELSTGRYVSDDVYVELKSGGAGVPGVSVEWEARDNISVEAETQADEGQKLTIQWKKDFD